MQLKSGYPFWPIRDGLLEVYPALDRDIQCDVLIVGGGITGALMAWHLIEAGFRVVVIDKRDIGQGSTAASTALLQFDLDQELGQLIELRGYDEAIRTYKVCVEFFKKFDRLVRRIHGATYERRDSLYLASTKRDAVRLRGEAQLRQQNEIPSRYVGATELRQKFGINRPGALASSLGATVDPFAMTHQLLADAMKRGLMVFDRTTMTSYHEYENRVVVEASPQHSIRAKHLVLATGFEYPIETLPLSVHRVSTFAFVSEPLSATDIRKLQPIIWETARPYLYLRPTIDRRIIVGGEDLRTNNPEKRDRQIPKAIVVLKRKFNRLFPDVQLDIAYAWAGTFAETPDSLPMIGTLERKQRVHVDLGYGANGTLFGIIAAEILVANIRGQRHPDEHLFSPQRKIRNHG